MIKCLHCTKQLFSMEDVTDVRPTGFALYGNCKYCNGRIPVSELWKKNKLWVIPAGQIGKGVNLT
jgi:DNA-directed RNA polymerase subunit RPC12/RpoP